jgi:hypothetical protein
VPELMVGGKRISKEGQTPARPCHTAIQVRARAYAPCNGEIWEGSKPKKADNPNTIASISLHPLP